MLNLRATVTFSPGLPYLPHSSMATHFPSSNKGFSAGHSHLGTHCLLHEADLGYRHVRVQALPQSFHTSPIDELQVSNRENNMMRNTNRKKRKHL